MKKALIVWPFISLLAFMIMSSGFGHPAKKKLNKLAAVKGFALVELFTSEGCSSCPPADDAVAALAKEYPSGVFVLSYHVDYWNYLGWKDPFSSADYSSRQQQYAAVFDLNSIYTPQVIVNGKTQFTGSDKSRLYNVVDKALNEKNTASIELSAAATAAKEVQVNYKTNADKNMLVRVALVQLQASNAIKRGENRGLQLKHIDVVRSFKTAGSNAGSISFTFPEGLTAKDCKVILFVQNATNMHIAGAAECPVNVVM
ncbi:MAG: DUF1223 domain-containing protein [Chitinophagaceae bacterium]